MDSSIQGNPFVASAFDPKTFAPAAFATTAATPPAVASPDVDADADALEVSIAWGDDVLHVAHLSPPRDVFVGEEGDVIYRLPSERIGASRVAIARVDESGVRAVFPPGAKLVAGASDGAHEVALARGGRVAYELAGFVVRVSLVAAARRPERRASRSQRAALGFFAVSALAHVAIVGALMMSPGGTLDEDDAALDKSTAAYVMQLQKNSAAREIPEQETTKESASDKDSAGGSGKKHAGDEGQMGDPAKAMTNSHYQIKGPPDTKEVTMAKARALIESNSYGAIAALAAVMGTKNGPIAFDSEALEALGRDPASLNGNLTGAQPGDSFGYNGLGLAGVGPGGGGPWDGIGLGQVGDFGHGGGTGPGFEWGGGPGGKPLKHKTKTVKMIDTFVDATGKLPPETIKRVIRANFPRFRACYEAGLKKDPGLHGTVGVRFIIDSTGAVETASLSGSTLGDAAVQSCVLSVYKTLSFPEPESGKVLVTYPIDFGTGD